MNYATMMTMIVAFATHLAFWVPWSAVCVGEGRVKGTLSVAILFITHIVPTISIVSTSMGGCARIDMVLGLTPVSND